MQDQPQHKTQFLTRLCCDILWREYVPSSYSYPGMNDLVDATTHCAECGEEGGDVSLKMCKACMSVKYCNATCQHKHWLTHKKECKLRAAELRDEVLFKDPPQKEDCSICFLPMPTQLISCISLPDATLTSVPIFDFAIANEELAKEDMETYFTCCGKSICAGCEHSFNQTSNADKCPFCNSNRSSKTDEEQVEELMKRVEANDAASICLLASNYHDGRRGFLQDHAKAIELYVRAANLGYSTAHNNLAGIYSVGGDMKKAKFHMEAAAMAGHEVARCIVGLMEYGSGNMERAVKHWTIGASAGDYDSMNHLRINFEKGCVSRELIDSTLTAYNNSCVEMRSEARDAYIRVIMENG
jgi:hypothetical protein